MKNRRMAEFQKSFGAEGLLCGMSNLTKAKRMEGKEATPPRYFVPDKAKYSGSQASNFQSAPTETAIEARKLLRATHT